MEKTSKKNELSPDSNIMEVIQNFPKAAEIMMEKGLPCVGCAAARFEKISDIASEFGIDAQELVEEIKKAHQK